MDVAEIVGVEEPETITDWLPAVMLLAHTTITVYVPGLMLCQAADWLTFVPVNATWRPWVKLV
ncbi:hypothetical protein GCM10010508_12330 [Streptomyces naganishii JCM 4654]|uniref:Uncharacterized protein n=1 Tax=Streptomyces naganishii JCM 4654 TaxID=1306179 RepID=A0A918Y0Y3_9ACTN|nr:hypothetical protein GCM10010508_12330 [Streptomyces naganishii JCM 4654]